MKSYKNAQEYTAALMDYLRAHGDEEQAVPMEAYMRHQFAFLGIRSPELKALMREWMRMHGGPRAEGLRETVRVLWSQPEREMQYAAMGLLEKRRREAGPAELPLLKELILTKPWWDTVDLLASHQVGGILANHREEREGTVDVWIRSGQLWLQRTALLYQLGYKGKTDTGRLFGYIRHCSDSTEFFIRKAIGWALREYSKTDEATVRAFIASASLSPLSVREALRAAERRKGAGGAVKE